MNILFDIIVLSMHDFDIIHKGLASRDFMDCNTHLMTFRPSIGKVSHIRRLVLRILGELYLKLES